MPLIRAFVLLVAISLPASVFAGGAGMGALSGLGEALQQMGERQDAHDKQVELIELQHKQEMERMQYQFELQRRAQEAQVRQQNAVQESARKSAQESANAQKVAADKIIKAAMEATRKEAEETQLSRQYLDQQHPGWRDLVDSQKFKKWQETLSYGERREFTEGTNRYFTSSVISRYKDSLKRGKLNISQK